MDGHFGNSSFGILEHFTSEHFILFTSVYSLQGLPTPPLVKQVHKDFSASTKCRPQPVTPPLCTSQSHVMQTLASRKSIWELVRQLSMRPTVVERKLGFIATGSRRTIPGHGGLGPHGPFHRPSVPLLGSVTSLYNKICEVTRTFYNAECWCAPKCRTCDCCE